MWFLNLPSGWVASFVDLCMVFLSQYMCFSQHRRDMVSLFIVKMVGIEGLRDYVWRFSATLVRSKFI